MVWQVIRIHWQRLRHNRVEWLLAFVVPVVFFSIFALIFTRGVGSTPRVKVVLVDQTTTEKNPQASDPAGQSVLQALRQSDGLKVVRGGEVGDTVNYETAESMVRRGAATIGVVLNADEQGLHAELLNDASDQVASQVVSALVMRAILSTTKPPTLPDPTGTSSSTDESPRNELAAFLENVNRNRPAGPAIRVPDIEIINVMGQSKVNPVVSVYAAGIAVMFLLFGATSGGGVLLEEKENQTLERLLSSQMTMDHLLLGKWFYLTLLGCVQVTVMFVWAQFVFGLDLWNNLDGFLIMTLATSAAAASFGLFLATLCRTRGQLNGLSVVAVLTMSALGGSMVPRYVMSESLRSAGLWTFNAWALDGYDKVFWRELAPGELGPQLTVLMGTSFGLLVLARLLAIRWETS